MSDPAQDGYHCHGPMVPVVVGRVSIAWECETCGVWRHRFGPGWADQRAAAEAVMARRLREKFGDGSDQR